MSDAPPLGVERISVQAQCTSQRQEPSTQVGCCILWLGAPDRNSLRGGYAGIPLGDLGWALPRPMHTSTSGKRCDSDPLTPSPSPSREREIWLGAAAPSLTRVAGVCMMAYHR